MTTTPKLARRGDTYLMSGPGFWGKGQTVNAAKAAAPYAFKDEWILYSIHPDTTIEDGSFFIRRAIRQSRSLAVTLLPSAPANRTHMRKQITLNLSSDDAEPILREAAENAAKFSAWIDHVTKRTWHAPRSYGTTHESARAEWQRLFLRAKRLVESFGVEYEQTSEEETMTVEYRYVGGKRKLRNIGGLRFNEIVGSKPDYDNPEPAYRGAVHTEACRQAAARVVRRWREMIAD